MTTLGKLAWHVHHTQLVERLTEGGLTARRKYIQENKPESEIETRLRLLKLVKDQKTMGHISKTYEEAEAFAWKVYEEAVALAQKAYAEAKASAYEEAEASAWKVYYEVVVPARKVRAKAMDSAGKVYDEALDRLHKKECRNCPWNGKTIFPGGNR